MKLSDSKRHAEERSDEALRDRSRARKLRCAKAFGITLLAMLLSTVLVSPFSATTATFFSSPEQSDFRFSDIFAQFANSRPVRQLEDRIVIVDIGNSGREEIAETLLGISACAPKAVGLDVMFGHPGDDDTMLAEAIAANPGIVMPVGVERVDSMAENGPGTAEEAPAARFRIAETSHLSCGLPESVTYAAVNLPTTDESGHSRVREYMTIFKGGPDGDIPSFPLALARVASPMAAQVLADRRSERGTVAYHSREFRVIPSGELAEHAAELEGKTVIVGSLNDAYDMHPTPVNSYMPGTLIHAHALATILDGVWYHAAPGWLDYALAAVVCFLIVLLCVSMKSLLRGMLVRALQVVLLYLFVRIGYTLFVEKNVICNFSYTVLMIAFGLFSVDLWNGASEILGIAGKKIKELTTRKEQTQCEEFS